MRILLTLILTGFTLTHCTTSDKDNIPLLDPEDIKDVREYPTLSQYTLTCTEAGLVATDQRANRIHIFDYETLELVQTFGREGRGPGEFSGAAYSVLDGESLYISDGGNRRINVFKKGDWSYETTIPADLSLTRFALSSGHLYLSSPFARKEAAPFMKINPGKSSVEYFGEWLNHELPGRNLFHLLSYQDRLIAVSQTEPLIRFYSKQGELLASHSLDNDKDLADVMTYINQFYQKPDNFNRTVILFSDVSVFENYLVLNVYTRPDDQFKSNNYLVYEIDKSEIKKTGMFETNLGEGFTRTFCIYENKLYSNGGSGGLNIYAFDLSFLD